MTSAADEGAARGARGRRIALALGIFVVHQVALFFAFASAMSGVAAHGPRGPSLLANVGAAATMVLGGCVGRWERPRSWPEPC